MILQNYISKSVSLAKLYKDSCSDALPLWNLRSGCIPKRFNLETSIENSPHKNCCLPNTILGSMPNFNNPVLFHFYSKTWLLNVTFQNHRTSLQLNLNEYFLVRHLRSAPYRASLNRNQLDVRFHSEISQFKTFFFIFSEKLTRDRFLKFSK